MLRLVSTTANTAPWQRHLKWLIVSLALMMLGVALVAIAGVLLKSGTLAELMALTGLIIAVPSLAVGSFAFLMLIYARLRDVLRREDDD